MSDPEKAMGLLGAPAELLSLQALPRVFRSEGKERPQRDHHQKGLPSAHEVVTSCMEKLFPAFHLSPLFSHSMNSLILSVVQYSLLLD